MTHKAVPFVVCHTLPEILRVSPSTIHKPGNRVLLVRLPALRSVGSHRCG
jgi:hypothetical protein